MNKSRDQFKSLEIYYFKYCSPENRAIMSTLLLEVDEQQEEVLKKLLDYMNIHFQKVSSDEDFLDKLSPAVRARIEQGKVDAEAGRYEPASQVIGRMLI